MRSHLALFGMRTNGKACLLLVSLIGLTGCGAQVLSLTYPPYRHVSEPMPALLSEALLPDSSRHINVRVFDFRTEKVSLGDEYNNFVTESTDSINIWVLSALKYELGNAGYQIFGSHENATAESDVQLTVDVQMVLGEAKKNGAQVLLQGTLENKGMPLLVNQYEGRDKLYSGTSKGFANSLSHALEDAIRQMLVDMRISESL